LTGGGGAAHTRRMRAGGEPISLVLADDHHVVRQALRTLLETDARFVVLGECADGLAVAETVERLRPDVLVVDLVLPGLGGLEVTRQVCRRTPLTRVLILSMNMSEAHVLQALRNGARAYVRKDDTAADLKRAIEDVANGRLYLSPPFSDRAIEAYRQRALAAGGDDYENLTGREREVLQLAAEGFGNSEIAARLGISPRTAETHRANLMRKLSLRRPVDLVRYALRRGLLPDDQAGPSN
jgi:two-component system response regulator NreC